MLNASVLDQYPGVDTDAVQALLEEKCRQDRHKIIVLDDDPTGVQTVHDVSCTQIGPMTALREALKRRESCFTY